MFSLRDVFWGLALSSISLGIGLESFDLSVRQCPKSDDQKPGSNDGEQWYAKESFLLWKPFEDNIDFVDKVTTENDEFKTVVNRLKHPNYEWSSGVRITLGTYLPNYDQWDFNIAATYYYTQAKNHAKGTSDFAQFLDSSWLSQLMGSGISAHVLWKMNFFTGDLVLGRSYPITPHFTLRPFLGVRGALIIQEYHSRMDALFLKELSFKEPEIVQEKSRFTGDHDFWGVGPRIGADMSFDLSKGWSILTSLSAAFFYGRYTLSEKFFGFILRGSDFTFFNTPFTVKGHDADSMLRTNLEGMIGIGWEKWIRNRRARIAPSIEFAATEWFAIKKWFGLITNDVRVSIGDVVPLRSNRHYTDLGLWGINFNLQFDW